MELLELLELCIDEVFMSSMFWQKRRGGQEIIIIYIIIILDRMFYQKTFTS